jgi:hypothetical protein
MIYTLIGNVLAALLIGSLMTVWMVMLEGQRLGVMLIANSVLVLAIYAWQTRGRK